MTRLKMVMLDVETMTIEPENIGELRTKNVILIISVISIFQAFHNLRGYDGHFITKQAHEILSEINNPIIDAIPNSYEKIMSFNMGNLRCIDSCQFMASSLDTLVRNLYDEKDKYNKNENMNRYYSGENLDLLCRNCYDPYEWVDSDDKLNCIGLPEKETNYSALTKESIDDVNYNHAVNVYNKLGCKSLRD